MAKKEVATVTMSIDVRDHDHSEEYDLSIDEIFDNIIEQYQEGSISFVNDFMKKFIKWTGGAEGYSEDFVNFIVPLMKAVVKEPPVEISKAEDHLLKGTLDLLKDMQNEFRW